MLLRAGISSGKKREGRSWGNLIKTIETKTIVKVDINFPGIHLEGYTKRYLAFLALPLDKAINLG